MIKLIAIDMDETFLRSDKTYDVDRFKRVEKQLREQGIVLVIASGNSYDKLRDCFDDETLAWIYLAGDNGNHILQGDKLLQSNDIERETAIEIANYMNAQEDYYTIIRTTEMSYALTTMPAEIYKHFEMYNPVMTKVSSFADISDSEHIVKIAIIGEKTLDENKKMMQWIKNQYSNVSAVTSGDIWLDVFHPQGGKGSAIAYFQDKYGILPAETIAFGDSLNDLTMMQAVGYSVAMGNADPELAQICRYQIGTNNEQAVLDVLESIVEGSVETYLKPYAK